jgi:hypothetical protein
VAPFTAAWSTVLWFPYVKSVGTVALHVCASAATAASSQTFNIRFIN